MKLAFAASAVLFAFAAANTNDDDSTHIFDVCGQWESGLVDIHRWRENSQNDIFYWLFKSQSEMPEKDPLVIWLSGGPGCASSTAMLTENGPCKLPDDPSQPSPLQANEHAWNKNANVIYLDQPIGTGFSNAQVVREVHNMDELAEDFYAFLQGFLLTHEEYIGRDFYITGESYAGHYIPAISYHLVKEVTDLQVQFKGIAIGNGIVNDYQQQPEYATFAYANDLISLEMEHILDFGFKICQALVVLNNQFERFGLKFMMVSTVACEILMFPVLGWNPEKPNFNVYDIREPCEFPPLCYDFRGADLLFNNPTTQLALGVPERKWSDCDDTVHFSLIGDGLVNYQSKVETLLQESDLQVLIYSGNMDWICNWMGGQAWTNSTRWSGKEQFNNAKYVDWMVGGEVAGQQKTVKPFTFLTVANAGHLVPMDQPKNSLSMLQTFLNGGFPNTPPSDVQTLQ